MSYTEVSISSYNATPPTDDGATGSANEVTWAGIKTKLGNPINTAVASVDDNVSSACTSIDSAVTSANTTISTMSSSLTTAQSALYAPAGTAMLFMQTNAPTLWTKSTTHNNKALRLVTGTASSGGSTAFTSVFASRTLTTAELPLHTHTLSDAGSVSLSRTSWTTDISTDTSNAGQGGSGDAKDDGSMSGGHSVTATITHSGTSGPNGSGTAMDFAVQYVDVIIATKD